MNRFRAALGIAAFTAAIFPASGAQFKILDQTITVPDGFKVELVAGPPLVDRPIVADFDDLGRLYVADSSGSNEKVEKQLEEKPHRIVRLEDTDGDGRFDKSVVFADKMMFPEGAMWFDGSFYVSAPPSIWKLTDTDGDGIADKREEWFKGKTLTGCANDLHGPYLGPDGWIYWCKGAFAKQTYELPGEKPFETRAAHIFRCRPDGTGIEPVMTGGMDNPVEVAFTSTGERIFTTTFFQHPGGGQRDGLIHAIYGGVYGKVHDVIDDHKKTGELMPVLSHLGPAAPSGLMRYESDRLGKSFTGNLFAALFNLHKITRHELQPDGATFLSKDTDFLVSDNTDFHPTDVLEDADGSLLVVDTGGWYKLCCPTSQLSKPDVLGAIYRVRRSDAPQLADPRGLKLKWEGAKVEELAARIKDNRPAVRKRAVAALGKKGDAAVKPLAALLETSSKRVKTRNLDLNVSQTESQDTRQNAVWALTRIDSPAAREAVRKALNDPSSSVQQTAIHSASVWKDSKAVPQLIELLKSNDLQVRRSASEALGRVGEASAVQPLLTAASELTNTLIEKTSTNAFRVLEHSLIYALIEIGDEKATLEGLNTSNSQTKRAALIALDQMSRGTLKPDAVAPLLVSEDATLKKTAAWIVSHRPEWGSALAGFFKERLTTSELEPNEQAELQRLLGLLSQDGAIRDLLAKMAGDQTAKNEVRLVALRAMSKARLKEVPESWLDVLARELSSNNQAVIEQAVGTIRTFQSPKSGNGAITSALLKVAQNATLPANVRLDALASIPGGLSNVSEEIFRFVQKNLNSDQPVHIRGTASSVLSKAKLTPNQQISLAESLKNVGPMEISKLLPAFEASPNEDLGAKLLASLKASPGLSGVRPENLKPLLSKYPSSIQKQGDDLINSLNLDAAKQKEHLDQLVSSFKDGDIRRGQAIFNSAKAACSSCHAIGYLGGNLGPDLTRIGQIRTERDLLEAVVYPSASFVRSYEPVIVVSKSGEEYSGVLRKDALDEVILGTGPGSEARIARGDIAEMRPGTLSVMPQGLDEQLSRQELADLVAFLKATRW